MITDFGLASVWDSVDTIVDCKDMVGVSRERLSFLRWTYKT